MKTLIIAINMLFATTASGVSGLNYVSKTTFEPNHCGASQNESNKISCNVSNGTPSEVRQLTTQGSHHFTDSCNTESLTSLMENTDPIWKRSSDTSIETGSCIYPKFGCFQHVLNSCSKQNMMDIFKLPQHVFRNFFNILVCVNDCDFLRKIFAKQKLSDMLFKILDIYQDQYEDICDLVKRNELGDYYYYIKKTAYFIADLTEESVCYVMDGVCKFNSQITIDGVCKFNSQSIIDKIQGNEVFTNYIKKNVLSCFCDCWMNKYEFVIPCLLSMSCDDSSLIIMMQNAENKLRSNSTAVDCEDDIEQNPSFAIYTMLHSRNAYFNVKASIPFVLRCADVLLQYNQTLNNGEKAGEVIFYNFRYFFPQCFFRFASFLAGHDGRYLWQILPHLISAQQLEDFQQFIECVRAISILIDQETRANKQKITDRIANMMHNVQIKKGLLQLLQSIYYDYVGYDEYLYYRKTEYTVKPVCHDLFINISCHLNALDDHGMIALFRNKLLAESPSDAIDFSRLFWNGSTFITKHFCYDLLKHFSTDNNSIKVLQFCSASAQSLALSSAIIQEIMVPGRSMISELFDEYAEIFPLFKEMLAELIDEPQTDNVDKFEAVIRLVLRITRGQNVNNELMMQNLVKTVSITTAKDALLQICNNYFLSKFRSAEGFSENDILHQFYELINQYA